MDNIDSIVHLQDIQYKNLCKTIHFNVFFKKFLQCGIYYKLESLI